MEVELRKLDAKGKCICCGDEIKRKDKEVFVIKAQKSQVYQITICQNCVKRLNDIAMFGN